MDSSGVPLAVAMWICACVSSLALYGNASSLYIKDIRGAATGARTVHPIPFSTYGTCVTETLSGSLSPFKLFIEGRACSAGSYETAFLWLWSQPWECEEPQERAMGPPNRCWRAWQPDRGQWPHTSSAQGPRGHAQPVAVPSDHLGMNE